jgi:WXG100 family type VII secretion target
MSTTAEPYSLQHAASRFSSGATELRHKAAQLERSSMNLTQGPGSWQGAGAESFTGKTYRLRGELEKAATILESAANALNRFATKMEHVNELRRQAQQAEQQSWQIVGDTPDDLHHRQNLAHRANQLRHEADWEANTADSQASTEFNMMMSQAQHIMEAVGQFMSRTPDDDRRDAAYESYYARHHDLYEDEDADAPLTMGSYKRADYEGVRHLEEQHEQLVAQVREIIKRRDVPGYITDPDEIERIVDENFQAECGRYTDEELATFIRVQEDSERLAADMQSERLAGEDITQLPRYREYLFSQVGMEPMAMGFEGGEEVVQTQLFRKQETDITEHAPDHSPNLHEAAGITRELNPEDNKKLEGWNNRPNDDMYLKYKEIFDDPQYYDQAKGNINWPQNHGFEGDVLKVTLESGTLIDRYGGPKGSFFSPEGIPYEQRALPLHSEEADYFVYKVLKPLEVDAGKIAPWFGREGGGTQFVKYKEDGSMYTIRQLAQDGYIGLALIRKGGPRK